MKANRLVLLAVTGTALLALTGCSQSSNVAARVGATVVPTSEVDFLTRMQCDSLDRAAQDPAQAAQGGVQVVPIAQVRTGMVNTLVQSELNRQLAARDHLAYNRSTLRSVMTQFESALTQVPEKDRAHFRDVVEDVYRGQLQVYTFAEHELATQGVPSPTQDQVDKAVAAVQASFRKTVDVKVNPEYGADAAGVAGSVDPSLSLAVSSFAKQARSASPDATWVGKLPADQRCG